MALLHLAPGPKEAEMILHALGAANAITRTPITLGNIQEARDWLESTEKLWHLAVEERLRREESVATEKTTGWAKVDEPRPENTYE